MLRSMTGFGEARRETGAVVVAVEVRSVNSKYFKLTVRGPEGYSPLEPRVEQTVRRHIKRGTVLLQYRADRVHRPETFRIDRDVLSQYRDQLKAIFRDWNGPQEIRLDSLLLLPGVVQDGLPTHLDPAQDWPVIKDALEQALEQLAAMREEEGEAMAAELETHCRLIAERLERIEQLAPVVIDGYRRRLTERVGRALAELDVTVQPADLIREVTLFGERSDISEETARLRSHLDQFRRSMGLPESSGRKLEFLTQEMFRETNTIGSKANDVQITELVVDVKATIERIREQVQNVE